MGRSLLSAGHRSLFVMLLVSALLVAAFAVAATGLLACASDGDDDDSDLKSADAGSTCW